MTDQPTITAAQVAEYQRQQAAAEQQAINACGEDLSAVLRRHGYAIVAWPVLTPDGRTVAQWGLRRVQP